MNAYTSTLIYPVSAKYQKNVSCFHLQLVLVLHYSLQSCRMSWPHFNWTLLQRIAQIFRYVSSIKLHTTAHKWKKFYVIKFTTKEDFISMRDIARIEGNNQKKKLLETVENNLKPDTRNFWKIPNPFPRNTITTRDWIRAT